MEPRRPNRLIHSTSPYLLQHAFNPVDWYPWGDEALTRAREENRPIFLSIGYAACHWCHVMERESFEDPETAEILNRDFISVKVDREERPDLDEIYMTATQLLTQSGGWPMSVFLTPDLKPFYAGTYFPPEDRWGRPGFRTLLREIARAWQARRASLEEQAARVAEAMRRVAAVPPEAGAADLRLLESGVAASLRGFDALHGGFGGAPKFPPSMRLELLLRRSGGEDPRPLQAVETTLERMARGGLYDQIGGGFHRYSVDERWLVPHFEKMLYDNALLARVYALAWERTGRPLYRRIATETLDYLLREMADPQGGFYSSTDADSEGEEGKFFLWTPEEVRAVLGPEEGELFCRIYDITPEGNFEGRSIPNLLVRSVEEWAGELGTTPEALEERLAGMRRRLWERREQRIHPLRDDKVLTAWNGLTIHALAEAARLFGEPRWREAAERAAAFLLERLQRNSRLLRAWRAGEAHLNGYLEDYACLALALLELHAAAGEPRWRDEALRLLDSMDAHFWDAAGGGYFFTSHDHEALLLRLKGLADGATPSGNSAAARALIRAARLAGEERRRDRAARILSLAAPQIQEFPAAFPNLLVALDEYLAAWPEGVPAPAGAAVPSSGAPPAGAPAAPPLAAEAFLSRAVVAPGDRLWVGLRLAVAPGYHVNSRHPRQEYLVPTRLRLDAGEGFRVVRESYPEPTLYRPPFQEEPLSVYADTLLLGLELEAEPGLPPGERRLLVALQAQPCDDRQCHPPVEARVELPVRVAEASDAEGHEALFAAIRAQAEAGEISSGG